MPRSKKKDWLKMPIPHSTFNDDNVEEALLEKARELIAPGDLNLQFMMLSGNFFETKGYAYSAIRDWRGMTKPSKNQKRKPILDATFACLSVYLGSLVSFQVDFWYAYDEIKKILIDNDREDLWIIIEEKLPFVSMPPAEMFPEKLKSPISPYYVIKQDEDLCFGELYPSVYLSNIVKSLKSRFFCFFSYQGYTAFGFFNLLPLGAKFGFEKEPKDFEGVPTSENIIEFTNNCETIKDLYVALITAHNASMLEQFLIEDYETLLNNLLEMDDSGGLH
ncbi:MAG: hypothetical protein GF364_02270 [Candidatus Lokiarchaeota archaeon]|nr:hypothetical protein [Candidatus Lokiarchaeota archaeon]